MGRSSATSEILLSIENVTISREMDVYRHMSFRDGFVAMLSRQRRHTHRLVPVLKNVTLNVRRGDRLGILGPNGAGKSTLCRCAAGLLPPDQGNVGYVGTIRAIFEAQLAIQPELTGRENGHFLADFLYPELGRVAKRALIEDALRFSGLGKFLDAPFKSYSFGMQTRLGLSILSSAPSEILILDEVFQGADAGFQVRITDRFYAIMRDSGAVLFVSHTPEEVRRVCNRVAVLDQGQIVFDGDVDEGIGFYERLCAESGAIRGGTEDWSENTL